MTADWITGVQARLKLGVLKWPGDVVRHVRVVQSLPLGPGSRLLVVEFGGRRVLVGQARGGLVTLAEAEAE
jgi:flagellar protein FliO/FliZ